MHFKHIAISSLLVGASIAKPVNKVARQEAAAEVASIQDMGALPVPEGLIPGLTKRQQFAEGADGRGVDAVEGVGNREGGPPEGQGSGNGSGGRQDPGENNNDRPPPPPQGEDNGLIGVDATEGVGNREGGPPEGTGNGRGAQRPDDNDNFASQQRPGAGGDATPPPPPPPAETAPPPPAETAAEPPKPEETQAAAPPPPPPAAGDDKVGALAQDIAAKMMEMVLNLGPITQFKAGMGVQDGSTLPKINNVDSSAS